MAAASQRVMVNRNTLAPFDEKVDSSRTFGVKQKRPLMAAFSKLFILLS